MSVKTKHRVIGIQSKIFFKIDFGAEAEGLRVDSGLGIPAGQEIAEIQGERMFVVSLCGNTAAEGSSQCDSDIANSFAFSQGTGP
jgi:hypothetical protein